MIASMIVDGRRGSFVLRKTSLAEAADQDDVCGGAVFFLSKSKVTGTSTEHYPGSFTARV